MRIVFIVLCREDLTVKQLLLLAITFNNVTMFIIGSTKAIVWLFEEGDNSQFH